MYARLIESVSLKKVIVVKYIFTETETKFELKLSDGQFKNITCSITLLQKLL